MNGDILHEIVKAKTDKMEECSANGVGQAIMRMQIAQDGKG